MFSVKTYHIGLFRFRFLHFIPALLIIVSAFVLTACRPSKPIVSWKADVSTPRNYRNVMVVVIMQGNDSVSRSHAEDTAVLLLKQNGVDAIAASATFGLHGFANLSQDSTFRTLCENGVDAVLSIVAIGATDKFRPPVGMAHESPALYFFNRIWRYRQIGGQPGVANSEGLYWESILFDLALLQPAIVLNSSPRANFPSVDQWISSTMRQLFKLKVVEAGKPKAGFKAF